MARRTGTEQLLRLSAAIVGTLPLSLYAPLVLVTVVPLPDEARAALGLFAPLPAYALFGCLVARVSTGARAWLVCLVAAGLLRLALALG